MVAQSLDWEDRIQTLNISGPENAHLAQIDDTPEREAELDPEEEMMELLFAFMAKTTPEPAKPEVSEISCSQTCINIVKFLHEQIELIKRENMELMYER